MSDEEVKLLTETLKNKDDYIKELKQKIIKQDEKIDKAIKYMKSWGEEPAYGMEIQMKQDIYFEELLKIFKGE